MSAIISAGDSLSHTEEAVGSTPTSRTMNMKIDSPIAHLVERHLDTVKAVGEEPTGITIQCDDCGRYYPTAECFCKTIKKYTPVG